MEGQKVWNSILTTFKSQISQSTYKTWFSGSYVLDFKKSADKNLLIVAVQNHFLKEQLEQRYLPQLTSIIHEKAFGEIEVVFVVSQKEVLKKARQEPLFSGEPLQLLVNNRKPEILNPNHTFENFVVGPSNNLAYLASSQVAAAPGSSYNPLLVYGPTGVGKTHLLQAIGNEILNKTIDAKVLYVTAEKFTNDYIESLHNRTQMAFREKYRKVDVFLVDDVQFFAGKESTQDEFFHTFNELFLSSRQIILACDRHPKELGRLKERLTSRFLGGMAASVEFPDVEMKTAILKMKCQEKGIVLEGEIVSYIASECTGGARELEGLLTSVLTLVKLSGGAITVLEIQRVLAQNPKGAGVALTSGKIIDAVCKHFKLGSVEVRSQSRKASIVSARQVLMYLLRREINLPLSQIGELIGGRDHSTVIHGIEKVTRKLLVDQTLKDEVLRIQGLFNPQN